MPVGKVGSAEARYLSSVDLLVGDMSDTNYEFLLFDRPVVLLANEWIRANLPEIGPKTDLTGLKASIDESLADPGKCAAARKEWREKTIHKPDGRSSGRVLGEALRASAIDAPIIGIVHDNCPVKITNLRPLYEAALEQDMDAHLMASAPTDPGVPDRWLFIAAHFGNLDIPYGYKVHVDHGLKGQGTANVEMSMADYRRNNYFPGINLHITAGRVGDERTKMLLGPLADRTRIAGYPKADDLLRHNTPRNRELICEEFGFDPGLPIVAYAPAGPESEEKPGGSLAPGVLRCFKEISSGCGYNILLKMKYREGNWFANILGRLYAGYRKLRDIGGGPR